MTLVLVAIVTAGCSTLVTTLQPQDDEIRETVASWGFDVALLRKRIQLSDPRPALVWIFIEGDGLPWSNETTPSLDPTPRDPIALRMFRRTDDAALYVGRPCYWGTSLQPPCRPYWWTQGRYSSEIIGAMAAAIRYAMQRLGDPEVVLVGYSGGGVIAALLGHELSNARGVVAVAAPLDHRRWTTRLGISDLPGSLNPASVDNVAGTRLQVLLAFGDRDPVVVPSDAGDYLARPAATVELVAGFDHVCCWVDWWVQRRHRIRSEWLQSGSIVR